MEKRGLVCTVCDRKFYIYAIFKLYWTETKSLDLEIKTSEERFEAVENDLKVATRQYERQKELNKQFLDSYTLSIESLEVQLNQAKALMINTKEDISSQNLLISKKDEEMKDIEADMETKKKRLVSIEYEIDECNKEINQCKSYKYQLWLLKQ